MGASPTFLGALAASGEGARAGRGINEPLRGRVPTNRLGQAVRPRL